jgi:uncharacterized protein YbjT (DUF2867 family)
MERIPPSPYLGTAGRTHNALATPKEGHMIVVTAPTGNIGHQVLEGLLARGEPVRVVARDPLRLPPRTRERIDVVQGSHGDFNVVSKAFAGADAVFWLVPPSPGAESLEAAYLDFSRPACEALKSHGVRRVVGISALGRGMALARDAGLVTASLAMDDMIAATGVSYRALTMPSFMDNMLRHAGSIRDRGLLSLPLAGDRKLPICATRDIAASAVRLLRDPSWTGRADVPVLGPEDLSHNDMAQIMSEVLERPVRFERMPLDAFKVGLAARGMSRALVEGCAAMFAAKNNGLDNAEPRTPESTTPTSFRRWCREVLKRAMIG